MFTRIIRCDTTLSTRTHTSQNTTNTSLYSCCYRGPSTRILDQPAKIDYFFLGNPRTPSQICALADPLLDPRIIHENTHRKWLSLTYLDRSKRCSDALMDRLAEHRNIPPEHPELKLNSPALGMLPRKVWVSREPSDYNSRILIHVNT